MREAQGKCESDARAFGRETEERAQSGARSAERERENFGKVFLIRGERVSGIKVAYFICFALKQYSVLIPSTV